MSIIENELRQEIFKTQNIASELLCIFAWGLFIVIDVIFTNHIKDHKQLFDYLQNTFIYEGKPAAYLFYFLLLCLATVGYKLYKKKIYNTVFVTMFNAVCDVVQSIARALAAAFVVAFSAPALGLAKVSFSSTPWMMFTIFIIFLIFFGSLFLSSVRNVLTRSN